MAKNTANPADSTPTEPARPAAPREIDSQDLMQGAREIAIRHGDDRYRLTLTRAGKLILHK